MNNPLQLRPASQLFRKFSQFLTAKIFALVAK
jgi:hypothetical protein